ncbi:SirB1 family protein [Plesiomonas shigelloides]|uniref:SirB1 family protein n=1 Tax=Plesiomonas shigelloides TaxID=703 RepID=UPI001E42759D|nr:tetratricopeptide repeat protein [Plesiomonas shigelloides]
MTEIVTEIVAKAKSKILFDFEEHTLAQGLSWLASRVFPDFDADEVERTLAQLCDDVRELHVVGPELARTLALLEMVYQDWGFHGDYQTFYRSDNLRLDKALSTRQGGPVVLGILLLTLASELDLPLYPVVFPTQFLVRAEFDDTTLFINPFNGEIVDGHILTAWLKGQEGMLAELRDEDVDISCHSQVMMRVMDAMKAALMHEKSGELALQVSALLLERSPGDPYEIRDRGLIYATLDCTQAAKDDLTYFIKQCPKDPVIALVREQVRALSIPEVVLH